MKALYKLITVAMVLAPAKLFACAACFANGADINDPMVDGMNWAILTLGVFIATVLAGFLAYFIYIMRRSEKLEAAAQQSLADHSKVGDSRGGKNQTEESMELPYAGSAEPAKV